MVAFHLFQDELSTEATLCPTRPGVVWCSPTPPPHHLLYLLPLLRLPQLQALSVVPVPATGPLHLLWLPGMFFPLVHVVALSFPSGLCSNITLSRWPFLTHSVLNVTSVPC